MGAHQTMKKNNGRQIPSWNAPCTLLLSVIMEEIRVCAKPAPWPKTQSTERQTLSLNSMIAIPIESSNYLEVRGGGWRVEEGGSISLTGSKTSRNVHKWDLILVVEMWCDWPAYRLKQYINSCHTGPPNNTTHNKKPTVTSNKSQKAIRKCQFSFAYNREFSFFSTLCCSWFFLIHWIL